MIIEEEAMQPLEAFLKPRLEAAEKWETVGTNSASDF